MALPGPQPQRRIRHGLRRHTGKGAVNFIAPVHTLRRWDWLHNRMVPAVLRVRDYAPHANATHATNPIIRKLHGSLIVRVAPKAASRRATSSTPFPIACRDGSRDAIRLSLPQAKVLNRRRQGLRPVALAITRDLCGILLKAVVVQYFAITGRHRISALRNRRRYWRLWRVAGRKYALTSALAATEPIDESGDRGGRRDC